MQPSKKSAGDCWVAPLVWEDPGNTASLNALVRGALSWDMYGSRCWGRVIKYSPTQVMYSEGEKEKSGMSAVFRVPWPVIVEDQVDKDGINSSCEEIGWNMIEKVVFWRSEHVELRRDMDCCKRGVAEPVLEETAVNSSDKAMIAGGSSRNLSCCWRGLSKDSGPRYCLLVSRNEVDRLTSSCSNCNIRSPVAWLADRQCCNTDQSSSTTTFLFSNLLISLLYLSR